MFSTASTVFISRSHGDVGTDDHRVVEQRSISFGLRNVGSGLAVLDRWDFSRRPPAPGRVAQSDPRYPSPDPRPLLPGGDLGFWQGAFRDPDEPIFQAVATTITRMVNGWGSTCCTAITRAASTRSPGSGCIPATTVSGSRPCRATGTSIDPRRCRRTRRSPSIGDAAGRPPVCRARPSRRPRCSRRRR